MNNWKEYKLGDIIKIKHGFAFKGEYFSETPTKDILLSPGNFNIGGGFKIDKFKYYKGDYPDSYILNEGDIIVTMTDLSKEGDTLGYSAKIPKHSHVNYLHNQRLGLVQLINNNFNKDFIYWILRTKEYQNFIVSSATGTTVRHTSPSRICDYIFKAPDYNHQTFIANTLNSIEEKIEVNKSLKNEIDNLVNLIFRRWFVEFEYPDSNGLPYKSNNGKFIKSDLGEIPIGWEVKELKDIISLIIDYRGKTPIKLGSNWSEDGIKAISAKNVKHRSITNLNNVHKGSEELYNIWMKEKLSYGDVILTSEAPLGETAILLNRHKYILSQRLFALRPNNSISSFFLFEYLSSNQGQIELEKRQSGSTVVGIKQKELLKIKIAIPNIQLIEHHKDIVQNLYIMRESIDIENEELANLRDTLLPKLINGEIIL